MKTANIKVRARDGAFINCRTLLDTYSRANFMTEELARKLQLSQHAINTLLLQFNQFIPISRKHSISLSYKISTLIPNQPINRKYISMPPNIHLADLDFDKPAPVQILLGTGPTLSFFSIGQIRLPTPSNSDLILQKTQLGWIIGGSVPTRSEPSPTSLTCHNTSLQLDLERFWKLEESATTPHLTSEEQAAEEHFKLNTRRSPDGRYVVALPFKDNKRNLGDSRNTALRRFHSLKNKLKSNPILKDQYTAVIQEYIDLGHLTATSNTQPGYYLPHHAVIKESSQTTKIRVVFDGSSKSNTGTSLNDTLMVGPTIQDDINSLLLRFRLYKYVLTGDIEKMYRQFLVREEDRKFQRIF
ncbi:PREDICTED: uncharacterized protein LOC108573927 [Habropoda laboriosa]|uniref:uncharacterized protein LOC108573927 n=1 Tax=Habropoda laboriosa TaxID=597456 RepID=UPI00083DC593|nr:PREDICTED: uncharacterized protein LOC108573927 [Habropoda laboriosa]